VIRLAIAGNVIDFGANSGLTKRQVHDAVLHAMSAPLEGSVESFSDAVSQANNILYLGDNGGEIVFDRLLVESYRTARGSRQRVVAYLGELKRSERSGWAQLGQSLSGKKKPQRSLFDPPDDGEPPEDETVLVRLKGVKLERVRDFGDVWMAWGLWRLLGLESLLAELIPRGQEEVPWATMAAILAIARFCQPQSELHIESIWYRATALPPLPNKTCDFASTQGMRRAISCPTCVNSRTGILGRKS